MRFATALVLIFFAAFFFYPLGSLAVRGVAELGSTTDTPSLLPGLLRVLRFSVLQAFASAALSVLVAIPGAYAVSHFSFRFRGFFQSLSLVPFVLPSVIVVICIISFFFTRPDTTFEI